MLLASKSVCLIDKCDVNFTNQNVKVKNGRSKVAVPSTVQQPKEYCHCRMNQTMDDDALNEAGFVLQRQAAGI